jgi:hypothetical protein
MTIGWRLHEDLVSSLLRQPIEGAWDAVIR